MAAAEDRQAKALEDIARSVKEIVRILAVLNQNIVTAFDEGQPSIDDLRVRAEKEHAGREQRADFEESSRHVKE
jgi:hypothetical protein